mmetsp:Transcript_37589/g.45928  ORF Transcript_37589/g.45928 Transcript_37589/m.45928 type:complete len:108 (-) Transcript_37589:462-785(-)
MSFATNGNSGISVNSTLATFTAGKLERSDGSNSEADENNKGMPDPATTALLSKASETLSDILFRSRMAATRAFARAPFAASVMNLFPLLLLLLSEELEATEGRKLLF